MHSGKILKLIGFLFSIYLLGVWPASCAEILPSCVGDVVAAWDNCIGASSIDDETYLGAFHKGRRHGEGRLIARDGSIYTGEFAEDKREGMGVIRFPNGEAYAGEFKEGRIHGLGTYSWPNGERYSGDFAASLKSGLGILSSPFAEPKIGEFGNGDYLGPLQKPPDSENQPSTKADKMMESGRHSLSLRKIIALSLLLTLGLFLLDCALFPPLAEVETMKRQNRIAWPFVILTMLCCGAAIFAGGQILFFGEDANAELKQALAPADEPGGAPM